MKAKTPGFAGAALVALALASPAAAQIETERTHFSIDTPVTVGSQVLEPGMYTIRVVRRSDQRSVVEVIDTNKKVCATALATPHPLAARDEAPEAKFVYYPGAPGFPKALRTWYPSDSRMAEDIVYTRAQMRTLELALAKQAAPPTETREVLAEAEETAPAPEPATTIAEAQPAPAPYVRPERLPKTASRIPLAGLTGLLSIGAAAVLMTRRRSV
jgi:hypothetical protein